MSVFHLNVQSIKANTAAEHSSFDMLLYMDSWFNTDPKTDDVLTSGFKNPFTREHGGRMGDGVIVFIQDNIKCVHCCDLEVIDTDCIWLELQFEHSKELHEPSISHMEVIFLHVNGSVETLIKYNNPVSAVGDLNGIYWLTVIIELKIYYTVQLNSISYKPNVCLLIIAHSC